MRPTLLNFRSPNETSPDFHAVKQDRNGNCYTLRKPQKNHRGSNFSRENRFKD